MRTIWIVVLMLLQVLIVLYIFSRLNVRFEIIVVAILGLIYVAVGSVGSVIAVMIATNALERRRILSSFVNTSVTMLRHAKWKSVTKNKSLGGYYSGE
jgi:uncharacterized membrane protein